MRSVRDMYLGCRQIQVATELIRQDPLHWLDLLDDYRATMTWSPNTAYGMVVSRGQEFSGRRLLAGGQASKPHVGRARPGRVRPSRRRLGPRGDLGGERTRSDLWAARQPRRRRRYRGGPICFHDRWLAPHRRRGRHRGRPSVHHRPAEGRHHFGRSELFSVRDRGGSRTAPRRRTHLHGRLRRSALDRRGGGVGDFLLYTPGQCRGLEPPGAYHPRAGPPLSGHRSPFRDPRGATGHSSHWHRQDSTRPVRARFAAGDFLSSPCWPFDLEVAPAALPAGAEAVSDLARQIGGIFAETLGRRFVAEGDNFFALGGTSLDVTRVVIRLERLAPNRSLHRGGSLCAPTPQALAVLLMLEPGDSDPVAQGTRQGAERRRSARARAARSLRRGTTRNL